MINMIFIIRDKQIRTRAVEAVSKITETPLMCVEIKEYKGKRTALQNAYYWSVMKLLSEHTGYEDDELHALFKDKFLHKEPVRVLGEYVKTDTTTTNMSKKEFSEYMEKIAVFCAMQLDFAVPPPNNDFYS